MWVDATVHVWRSEDNFQELVLSFYYDSEWPETLGPGTLGPGQGRAVPGRAREGQDSKKVLDFVS